VCVDENIVTLTCSEVPVELPTITHYHTMMESNQNPFLQ